MANRSELDSTLDTALAKYTAVEPRAGLEERVLANLQAERERVLDRASWRWSVAGALAAVFVAGIALAWRSGTPSHLDVANPGSRPPQVLKNPGTSDAIDQIPTTRMVPTGKGAARHQAPSVVAAIRPPKLDHFPSPQPLSEQEKLLQNYVARYPEHAVLVARALAGALRPDQLKEVAAFPSGDETADFKDQNNDTRER